MSLISKQIDELRAYAKNRKGELAKLLNDAADTIEVLSAKLSASNLERSSMYYHDGWIPCDERFPMDNYLENGFAGYDYEVGNALVEIIAFDKSKWKLVPKDTVSEELK